MGFFSSDSHQEVYNGDHQSKFSHELVGGAAAFEGMRLYEQHEAKEGKPENHQLAKELLAGFVGAETDKLFETKGLDYLDREKTKRHAQQEAYQEYDNRYQNNY